MRAARFVALTSLLAFPAAAQNELLDQLAGVLNQGKLNVEVNLKQGSAAITPDWNIQTEGAPKAVVTVEADEGRVSCLDVNVTGGKLIVAGKGLRPALEIEGLRFENDVLDARYRGRGVWRPIIAVFRTLARPALQRLVVNTDIPSIVRGEILGSKKGSGNDSNPEFLQIVREVRVHDSEFDAFAGYPFAFGRMIDFQTKALRVSIDRATFTPPSRFEADGRIDGEIDDGWAAFIGNHARFSRGQLQRGTFHASGTDVSFGAGKLAVDLTAGDFHWPGGPRIAVEAPSHLDVRELRVRPDAGYSGIVDAALFGKVGTIDRAGTKIAADDVQLHTTGAKIVDGKATGDVKLAFQYQLKHTLVVNYPVEELRNRKVPLLFRGAFDADFHFQNAGGDEGLVTGQYRFTIPWAPVEQAAFEVLRARWQQDIAPIRNVSLAVEPRRFGPCGGNCFLLNLKLTAAKSKLRQICETEGRADVVIDTPTRSLLLQNIKVRPQCEGLLGSVVNFVAPFLTRSYSDVAVMQMPKELPFTIDSVVSATDTIVIGGKIDWAVVQPAASP